MPMQGNDTTAEVEIVCANEFFESKFNVTGLDDGRKVLTNTFAGTIGNVILKEPADKVACFKVAVIVVTELTDVIVTS
jgi:hypothetical protein